VRTGYIGCAWCRMAGSWKHGISPSGSIEGGKFLDWLYYRQILKQFYAARLWHELVIMYRRPCSIANQR
jgi:hypothetical protein